MYLNVKFLNKTNLIKYIYNHYQYDVLICLFGVILTYKTISPIYSTIIIISLIYYSYFTHILLHIIPEKYNPHLTFHKFNNNNTDQHFMKNINISLVFKALIDVGVFVILYYFQILINYELFPPILILYYGIIYITVHNINYSLFHLGNHKYHLVDSGKKTTNFGPDSIDHLLGTNYNSKYEHMYHYIPNIIFAFLLTIIFFCNNNDIL